MKKSILFFLFANVAKIKDYSKKQTSLLKSIAMLCTATLLFSCTANDEPFSVKDSLLNQIKTNFNPNTFTDFEGGKNWSIDWNNYNELTKDSTQVYTFAIKQKNETKVFSDLFQEKVFYQIIGFKNRQKTSTYLLEVKSCHQSPIYTNDITHLENFNGIATVYTFDKQIVGTITFNAGKAFNNSLNNELKELVEIFNRYYIPKLNNKIPTCTVRVMIYDLSYVDKYEIWSTVDGKVIVVKYIGEKLISTNKTTVNIPYPCDSPSNTDEKYVVYRTSSYIYKELNPCTTREFVSSISQSAGYLSALNSVKSADPTKEHSITLGRDANGNITQAPMNNGGPVKVEINTSWAGAFGAIHNHPNKTPISGGDIYTAVTLNSNNSNFTTTFLSTDGEMYAAVVTDLAAAKAFVAAYPADIRPQYNPEFPDFILDQIDYIQAYNTGSTIIGRTQAMAFILNKYNAGITILKQDDSSGNFEPIIIKEITNPDGSKSYTLIPCN